ncbi:MAG TPA: uroporphyrinogen decarboxylase [Ktedonobacteraceae bacterium]|jgi:uroporphyrinogen decarboxylase|nr:uroporphyrinogen decarboxylase [Ktedonobacteraceae bacterium]
MQNTRTNAVLPARTGVARFLDACHHRQPDATPIWFMRQAGRCLAEYRALRQKYDMLTMVKTPELSAEVTLMPIEKLGVDAAIIYSDIMVPLEAMGVPFEIQHEVGPVIHHPIRTQQDIEALRVPAGAEIAPFMMHAIEIVRRELDGKQAVIGFAGAPFTLACYMVEGRPSRDYRNAKAMMYGQPELWHSLMEKLATVTARYLLEQVQSGVDAVQLFDSWIGALSPSVYQHYVQPYVRRIFEAVGQTGTPAIHFGTGTSALLESLTEAGGDIIGLDWQVDLDDAWARVGFEHGVQGNLDPALLLTSWPIIQAAMRDVLQRAANRPGHIFNLGHGVLAPTDPDLLRQLVEAVHAETQR